MVAVAVEISCVRLARGSIPRGSLWPMACNDVCENVRRDRKRGRANSPCVLRSVPLKPPREQFWQFDYSRNANRGGSARRPHFSPMCLTLCDEDTGNRKGRRIDSFFNLIAVLEFSERARIRFGQSKVWTVESRGSLDDRVESRGKSAKES